MEATAIRLYPARQRGYLDSQGYATFCTFNFGEYSQESNEGLGRIQVFNEDMLRIGAKSILMTQELSHIILLPVTGGLEVYSETTDSEAVYTCAGQALHILARPEHEYAVVNPYPDHAVSFLQIRMLRQELVAEVSLKMALLEFNLETKNELLPFFEDSDNTCRVSFGRFETGAGKTLKPVYPNNFFFVIEGALEVAGRLLYNGDALAFKNAEDVEFEALSDEVVFLFLETV